MDYNECKFMYICDNHVASDFRKPAAMKRRGLSRLQGATPLPLALRMR